MFDVIGVSLRQPGTDAVGEFFELFKTPWEYARAGRQYDVVITDNFGEREPERALTVVIHRGRGDSARRWAFNGAAPTRVRYGEWAFPVFRGLGVLPGLAGTSIAEVEGTGVCAGMQLRERTGTIVYLAYDFFEETRWLLTVGQPATYAPVPTVDIHLANLRNWMLGAGVPFLEVPPISAGSSFFCCLTHDVDFAGVKNYIFDRTILGFLSRATFGSIQRYRKGDCSLSMLARNLLAVLKLPSVYLGLARDPWDTFAEYREMEGDAPSTFFFVPFKGVPGRLNNGSSAPMLRAVKYDVGQLGSQVKCLLSEGCEIGVHGLDSWLDANSAERERRRIQDLSGNTGMGVRMHWLYSGKDSLGILDSSGYQYDSTWGYNEAVGYRAGTSQVFKPFGVNRLLELPMHIMDTALYYPGRMGRTLSDGEREIGRMIQNATQFGGVLTVNWHDRSIAPERLWGDVYRWAIGEVRRQGGRFLTAEGAVNWFRKRRAIQFSAIEEGGSLSRIKVAGITTDRADRMVLRTYRPSTILQGSPSAVPPRALYEEIALADQSEIEVSVD